MKKGRLLALLLLFTNLLPAQRKSGFGFVVKTGNFTLPSTSVTREGAIAWESGWKAGFNSQFGLYWQPNLGRRFALSAGLLYQFVEVSRWDKIDLQESTEFVPGSTNPDLTVRITETNFVAPFLFHFKPVKWPGTSFQFGLAASFNLTSEIYYSSDNCPFEKTNASGYTGPVCDCAASPPYALGEITVYRPIPVSSPLQLFWTGGVRRRLSEFTEIGAELLFSTQISQNKHLLQMEFPCCMPLLSYYSITQGRGRYPVYMKSLTLSLYHNILR